MVTVNMCLQSLKHLKSELLMWSVNAGWDVDSFSKLISIHVLQYQPRFCARGRAATPLPLLGELKYMAKGADYWQWGVGVNESR